MPKPLFTKLIAICAIGFFCVLIGCIYGIHSHDRMFILLSVLIGICSAIRFIALFQMIYNKSYRTVTGTCVKREPALLGKTQQLLFRGTDGIEYQFSLDKSVKLLQGHHYCLYFRVSPDQEDSLLSQDFLGYEETKSVR